MSRIDIHRPGTKQQPKTTKKKVGRRKGKNRAIRDK
jgi:hypothetical protein